MRLCREEREGDVSPFRSSDPRGVFLGGKFNFNLPVVSGGRQEGAMMSTNR